MAELTQAQIDKITALRGQTYAYVTTFMPEWRQLKWNQYVMYYESAKGQNINRLDDYKIDLMATMLNAGENYEDGYKRAIRGLSWLSKVVVCHDNVEKMIKTMGDTAVENFDISRVDYPIYPLELI